GRDFIGEFLAFVIEENANGCGGKKTGDLEGGRSESFEEIAGFDENAAAGGIGPKSEGAVALLGAEEHIEEAGDDGMVRAEEGDVFASERAGGIGGDGKAFVRETGDFVLEEIAGAHAEGAVAEFLDANVEVIEEIEEDLVEGGVG